MVNVPNTPDPEPEWTVYTNDDYDFQVSYPVGWKIGTQSLGSEPVISNYKDGQPPCSHHVNSTQVSIFPKGLGTEGPIGENRAVTEDLTLGIERGPREFFINVGPAYAYSISFEQRPVTWENFGYVWASVLVKDKKSVGSDCQMGDTGCDPFNTTKVSGSIDQNDFHTVKEILKTFRFN